MLKTNNDIARSVFRNIRKKCKAADEYISFIHRNFPSEEEKQYTVNELRVVASSLGIVTAKLSKTDLLDKLRGESNYMQALRDQLIQ